MMKKRFVGLLVGVLLTSASYADDYSFKVESLVGFEGGYTSFDVEKNQPSTAADVTKYNKGEAGLKIGAQTQNYRAFLSIRDYFVNGYDYFVTYGAEVQYLFNFSKYANFFIGANGGILDARFKIDGEAQTRTLSDPYYGGDIGFNFHAGKYVDIEIGGRVMASDAKNTKNSITYKLDNLVTGYASLIFRYQMD